MGVTIRNKRGTVLAGEIKEALEVSARTDGGLRTLRIELQRQDSEVEGGEAHEYALRGEDHPALVKVWDNEVDAAVYDKD